MAEPVKLVDMPGMASPADSAMITKAVDKLEELYPEMFSTNPRCRAPNVHNDNLREALFEADIVGRHQITSSEAFLAWMLHQNDQLKDKYQAEELDDSRIIVGSRA